VRWARHTLQHGPRINNEIYMSSVFVNMIGAGVPVAAHHVPIIGVGTAWMAAAYSRHVGIKLRTCFDLDNTLVTYPAVPGDYSTVRPIAPMVDLARQAKEHGHTIIIYTARRMATNDGNAAVALADIFVTTAPSIRSCRACAPSASPSARRSRGPTWPRSCPRAWASACGSAACAS
jgi:hypothetical protein